LLKARYVLLNFLLFQFLFLFHQDLMSLSEYHIFILMIFCMTESFDKTEMERIIPSDVMHPRCD
jgi:hypothetical protein